MVVRVPGRVLGGVKGGMGVKGRCLEGGTRYYTGTWTGVPVGPFWKKRTKTDRGGSWTVGSWFGIFVQRWTKPCRDLSEDFTGSMMCLLGNAKWKPLYVL